MSSKKSGAGSDAPAAVPPVGTMRSRTRKATPAPAGFDTVTVARVHVPAPPGCELSQRAPTLCRSAGATAANVASALTLRGGPSAGEKRAVRSA